MLRASCDDVFVVLYSLKTKTLANSQLFVFDVNVREFEFGYGVYMFIYPLYSLETFVI